MMYGIKLTVIIPVFNGEVYLQDCLESVLSQTTKEVQIICVDDGSTDDSLEVMKKYEQEYESVEVVHQLNKGLSAARNAGLKLAKGEYVQFLDCDDKLLPNAIEVLYKIAHTQRLDVLYFDGTTFFDDIQLEKKHNQYHVLYTTKVNIDGVIDGKSMFKALYQGKSYRASACLQLIRREYLQERNLVFHKGIFYEDNIFTLTAMLGAQRTAVCAVPYYARRMHQGSIVTSTKSFAHVRSYLICFLEISVLAAKNSYDKETMEGICAQLSSLKFHAREAWRQLPQEEQKKAELLPDFQWMQLILSEADSVGLRKAVYNRLKSNRIFRFCLKPVSIAWHVAKKIRNHCRTETRLPSLTENARKELAEACRKESHTAYQPQSPLISVIIPMYNVEAYLSEALDDLLQQTLKNFEIILVDDGSTDRSLQIIKEYQGKDKRIHLFQQEHQYAGVARNLGMSHAKGEYLLFLDADDRFEPDLLLLSLAKARSVNADVVVFDADILQHPSGSIQEVNWLCHSQRLPKQVFSGQEAASHIFDVLNSWTKLYRRAYIEKEGFQFQPLFCTNDAHFTMMALACAQRIITLPCKLIHYRVGMSSNIQSVKDKAPLDVYTAFAATKEALIDRGCYEIFARPLAAKAMESMVRQLDTLKTLHGFQTLYELLHSDGLSYLGSDMLHDKDMPTANGAQILRRCHDIQKLTFEDYVLQRLKDIKQT